jgi:hypothetical protein
MDDFPPVSYEEWKAEAHAVILEESRHGVHPVELKLDTAGCDGLDADDRRAAGLGGLEGIHCERAFVLGLEFYTIFN